MMRSCIVLALIGVFILHAFAQDGDQEGNLKDAEDDKIIAAFSTEEKNTARPLVDKDTTKVHYGAGKQKQKHLPLNREVEERWQERRLRWKQEHGLNNNLKQMESAKRRMLKAHKAYGHHVKNMFRKRLSAQKKQRQVM